MKTAMEKKETGLMRQIGYLSFVVGKSSVSCPLKPSDSAPLC